MPPHKLIQDAEAEVQTRPAAQGLTFDHTGNQSEVFRGDGSRVCWMFASHGVLQVQFDNVSNAPRGAVLEPVYEDFTDPVKAAEYILSLVQILPLPPAAGGAPQPRRSGSVSVHRR